jgi:phage baseplate assembly protein W
MMSRDTGLTLDVMSHIRQSIQDILTTPLGTRVMRREYGSLLFALTDAPMDRVTVLDIIQASISAIRRWEPRVAVDRVQVTDATPGHVTLALDIRYLPGGATARLEGIVV